MNKKLLSGIRVASVIILGLGLQGTGCGKKSPASGINTTSAPVQWHLNHAQPRLPTIKVWLGDQELETEVASRNVEIATGMMFRTNMLENQAMLFVFPNAEPRSFYMLNCTVPLTAAYINPQGVIEEFAKLDPGNTNGVPSRSWNIQYVLELPQGWHERHNISTGAVVRTERGSLRETFFGR